MGMLLAVALEFDFGMLLHQRIQIDTCSNIGNVQEHFVAARSMQ